MIDHKKLLKYEAELRRIAEHRRASAEKEIRRICSDMVKDLQGFLANEYALNADADDKLTFGTLYEKGRYARFVEECVNHIDTYTPELQSEIKRLVEDTYRVTYEGLCESVKNAADADALRDSLSVVKAVQPEVLKQTVENPISGLTLPERLEKHRTDIIYDIKQEIGIGLSVGERYSTMARRIRDKCNFGYTKAIRIVRTEAHRVREAGLNDCANEIDAAIQNGTSGLIGVKIWHTMKDERVRPQVRRKTKKGWKSSMGKGANHMIMEGQTVKIGEKFDLGDGVKADAPGKSGAAGHDINCRCFVTHDWLTPEEYAAVSKQGNKSVDKSEKSGIIKTSIGLSSGGQNNGDIPEHKAPEKIGNVDFADKQAVTQVITDFEKTAVNEKIETACVITKSGDIYKCYGNETNVYPDMDLGDKTLSGAVISHNHLDSKTEYSFSKEDISLFMNRNLSVLRGCDKKYVYELNRNAEDIDIVDSSIQYMTEENYKHAMVIESAKSLGVGYRRWKK